jgi:hypothetical protein
MMKVSELIDRLRAFDLDAEVYLQDGNWSFFPATWAGIMDTAGLFDEEQNPR